LDDGLDGGRHRGRGIQKAAPLSGWQPTATALIPAHNEEATIGEVVRACIESGYPLEDIFVVADSRTDRTAQVAREAGATTSCCTRRCADRLLAGRSPWARGSCADLGQAS
jgi:cellulose synthase/poly-beta-1,6-N-acetylglucosamine synthase-like glycosyltransferase